MLVSCHTQAMERIAALILSDSDRLIWRKKLTRYFQETGDWTMYVLPPSIILPGIEDIDFFLDIADGTFYHDGTPSPCAFGTVIPIHDNRLTALSSEAGIFISRRAITGGYTFESGSVRTDQAALFEINGAETRIVKRRPLRLNPRT